LSPYLEEANDSVEGVKHNKMTSRNIVIVLYITHDAAGLEGRRRLDTGVFVRVSVLKREFDVVMLYHDVLGYSYVEPPIVCCLFVLLVLVMMLSLFVRACSRHRVGNLPKFR
jgi:hypothetical protein